jgi:hypothetical protein
MTAWIQYARWGWYRTAVKRVKNIVRASRWTEWIGGWLPDFKPDSDWRYTFKTPLDDPVHVETVSWRSWVWGMLPTTLKWHEPASATAAEEPATPLPLTKSNFVDVLVAALEAIKAEARNKHNANITSAVVTKPDWVFNDLDRLVEEACLKADIEAFTLNNRVEAAVRVATRAGKQKVLLLEQTGYNFNMHEASSTPNAEARGSMSRNELSAAWIPRRLAEELPQAAILEEPAAARCDAGAQTRLVQEISKARALHRLQSGPDVGPGHDTWVIVRKLVESFTLDKPLLGESIARVEREYVDAVQEAVEDMLRKNHDIWEYLKEHGKMISIPTQCPQPMLTSPPRSLYQRHATGHPDDACQRSRNRKHHPRSPRNQIMVQAHRLPHHPRRPPR